MFWLIIVLLLVLWLIGIVGNLGGSLVHMILAIAIVLMVVNLLTGQHK